MEDPGQAFDSKRKRDWTATERGKEHWLKQAENEGSATLLYMIKECKVLGTL